MKLGFGALLRCFYKKGEYIVMKNIIEDKKIGLIGCGHLGSSIASALLRGGFAPERLMISCRGSAATLERARRAGAADCITDTASLTRAADIVILAVKPQDMPSILGHEFKPGARIISFMAGISLAALRTFFDRDICRAMCSGPDTIESGMGISTLWHANDLAKSLLSIAGIRNLDIDAEAELDAFTAGICIPPIITNIKVSRAERADAMASLARDYPVFGELAGWIESSLAIHGGEKSASSLENVSTKGGISEAMISSLRSGTCLELAVRRGIERGWEIRDDIAASLAKKVAAA